MRRSTFRRDAIKSVDADGDPIDTAPVNYKESIAIAAVAETRANAAVKAVEKSSSLKSQLSELRRYTKVSRAVVGVVCVTMMMLGEDIDNLLSDGGDPDSPLRYLPKHPQKLQQCWSHVKNKIHLLRRGPGIQNAPVTTRMSRWRAVDFVAEHRNRVDQVFALMDSMALTEAEVRMQSVAVKLMYCWVAASLVQLEMISASSFYDKL